MTKLFLRAALVGCAAAAVSVAQTPPPSPYSSPAPVAVSPAAPQPPAKTVLKTFDIADLVCPPADSPLDKPGTDTAMIAAARAFADVRNAELMKAMRACDTLGSSVRVDVTTDGKTLVVSGSEVVADKIGECLKSLRTARGSQVKVDMVVFTVPSGNEVMGKVFGDKPCAAVSPEEMTKLLRELKASGAVDILSRPTLMMTNRQTGFFQVGQACPTAGQPVCDSHGITTRVTPAVSADLKSVVLDLDLELSRPSKDRTGVDCQQTKTCMVVPDGGTMAVKVGTRAVEHKTETKVPVVSEVPYLGRLFTNVGISSVPTDTVAVVTVTRVADVSCVVPPKALAATPPMMPTAVPFSAPMSHAVRTVGVDGLERVGVSFNALTKPAALPPAPTRGHVVAPAGVTFTRYLPTDVTLAGGVIGATVGDDGTSLMAAYKAACAAGRTDEATRLGLQLLAKDPTCFGK